MLELQNLSSGYGDALVLRDFSCRFENGQVTALMGRNGMGKTTLLKTIMGLIKAKSGSVMFNGQALEKSPPHLISRAGIGYVPQGREIFEDFSVQENLRLGLLGHDPNTALPLDRIYDWFPILKERADQRAGTFSGGQQQILAIARALIGGPKMLLLDEPTEGIQPSIVHDIGLQLARIARETGLGILIVEQNVDMVRTLANQVLFMENGEIRESCDIEVVRRNDALLHRYLSV
ncbi:MAG: ABC transporter ATP-binding protein [Sneathiella sp.]